MSATPETSTTDTFLSIDRMLEEQQTLTAVEQFSALHEADLLHDADSASAQGLYRDLIPTGPPGEGEQFAFEVNLDACSGCKACVVACHNLNGLEEEETWRGVGMLVGGGDELPVLQHVTTACHHCLDPACASGCPVNAYEKDPETGIVRHLDDQCIGCQYCILKCPYDVPVYSKSKGIVRKCDMCHQRLNAGEAPACVQSCPNEAIRIRVVSRQQVQEESEAHPFLPGAPDPGYTLPTTVYKSDRSLPRNTLPADYFSVHRSEGHLALVVMLVLTQMSVGAFVVEHVLNSFIAASSEVSSVARSWHLLAALSLGLLGMVASIFHLGRPLYAYRALLGLRTSWLSREILAFSIFGGTATAYAAVAWMEILLSWQRALGTASALTGLCAVLCSVMIYVDTRRPLWTLGSTTSRFLLTCMVLGLPTALLISLCAAAFSTNLSPVDTFNHQGRLICKALLLSGTAKLVLELSVLPHLRGQQNTPHKRSALLLTGELSRPFLIRVLLGTLGGVVLPLMLLSEPFLAPSGYPPVFLGVTALAMLALLLSAELHARYLFFAASVAPRMPGAPAS